MHKKQINECFPPNHRADYPTVGRTSKLSTKPIDSLKKINWGFILFKQTIMPRTGY